MKMKKIKFLSIVVSCLVLQSIFVSQGLKADFMGYPYVKELKDGSIHAYGPARYEKKLIQVIVPPDPELHTATKEGDLETIKSHVKDKGINSKTPNSLLPIAAEKGHLKIIKYLLTNENTKDKITSIGIDQALYKATKIVTTQLPSHRQA